MSRARDAARWVVWGTKVVLRGAVGLVRLARGGRLRESMRPWMRFERADQIPFDLIAGQDVRAVLFDLENTLVPPGGPFTDDGRAVLDRARKAGLLVAVVSNASATWVRTELDREGIPYIAPAGKPGRDAFHRACRQLGVRPAHAVFIGDQMITDVIGAQRAGLRAILLEPRYEKESLSSRFQRVVTKGLLRLTRG